MRTFTLTLFSLLLASGCVTGGGDLNKKPLPDAPLFIPGFACETLESKGCVGNTSYTCRAEGEFLIPEGTDCTAMSRVCVDGLGCLPCRPQETRCDNNIVYQCESDGGKEAQTDSCDPNMGEACHEGTCRNLCEVSQEEKSYLGCEFFAADLDNATVSQTRDASAQTYAVVVSNPTPQPVEVVVEAKTSALGSSSETVEIARALIPAGDLEIFRLPRREVDGSSSMLICTSDADCSAVERCYCMNGGTPPEGTHDCRCRNKPITDGANDGTHSAITPHAYRIRSNWPVVAYQFNPLDNVGVFSNDASLLLPSSGTGKYYVVNGWPQTIAVSEVPEHNFGENLRAFIAVVGQKERTRVRVQLGAEVKQIVGVGPRDFFQTGDRVEVELGPFDVLNLETEAFNADFTGTIVEASETVSVFTGSEASDAPRFDDLASRRCCADHLEEQLFPTDTLGNRYFVARTPNRAHPLNEAFADGTRIGDFETRDYVRLMAVEPGVTQVTTTHPDHPMLELQFGESEILTADRDFEITSRGALSVAQIMASQEDIGIAQQYPGGDPSLLLLPAANQFRQEYVFLTPLYYGFDFITMVAPRTATLLLDGATLPSDCEVSPADGIERLPSDPQPSWVIYRCQLSFPTAYGPPRTRLESGTQEDGFHTLKADLPVSLVVSGFDTFVSYAYAGGMNLTPVE